MPAINTIAAEDVALTVVKNSDSRLRALWGGLALSKMSLADVIAKAGKDQPGTVYSVIPKVRDRKAVFVVMVADKGKSVELVYDALTGNAVKK